MITLRMFTYFGVWKTLVLIDVFEKIRTESPVSRETSDPTVCGLLLSLSCYRNDRGTHAALIARVPPGWRR